MRHRAITLILVSLCLLALACSGLSLPGSLDTPAPGSTSTSAPTDTPLSMTDTPQPTESLPPTETSIPVGRWTNARSGGFFARGVYALAVFNNNLFAGVTNYDTGGRMWRTADGAGWQTVSKNGFGSGLANPVFFDLTVYQGQLFAAVGAWSNDDGRGGEVWSSADGSDWERVVQNGFGKPSNTAVVNLAAFGDFLYACTFSPSGGTELWRSPSGDVNTWKNVVAASKFGKKHSICTSLVEFQGSLFMGVEGNEAAGVGLQIWKSEDGANWAQSGQDGFGDVKNSQTGGMVVWNGELFAGVRNATTGGQVWKTADGSTWQSVVSDGFGDPNNVKAEGLIVFGDMLYVVTSNDPTGLEVWRSMDGQRWAQTGADGFGTPANRDCLWSNGLAEFKGALFVGTDTRDSLAEIWTFSL